MFYVVDKKYILQEIYFYITQPKLYFNITYSRCQKLYIYIYVYIIYSYYYFKRTDFKLYYQYSFNKVCVIKPKPKQVITNKTPLNKNGTSCLLDLFSGLGKIRISSGSKRFIFLSKANTDCEIIIKKFSLLGHFIWLQSGLEFGKCSIIKTWPLPGMIY